MRPGRRGDSAVEPRRPAVACDAEGAYRTSTGAGQGQPHVPAAVVLAAGGLPRLDGRSLWRLVGGGRG